MAPQQSSQAPLKTCSAMPQNADKRALHLPQATGCCDGMLGARKVGTGETM